MRKRSFIVFALLICLAFVPYSFAQTSVTANPTATATAAPVTNVYTGGDPSLGAANAGSNDPVAYRGYNIVGNIPGVPLISHFGPRSNSGAFKTTPELLTYAWLFTEGALEEMAGGEAEFSHANNYKGFPKAGKIGEDRWIAIVLQKRVITKNAKNEDVAGAPIPFTFTDSDGKIKRAAFRGYANSYAQDEETKMQNTLAAGALKALKAGCNVYEVTDEGAAIDTQSRGWTVGLYSSVGYMPSGNNQTTSTVSGVGAAYGRSTAGMRDKPWVNGNGLVVPDFVMADWVKTTTIDDWAKPAPTPTPAPAPAPEPQKQTGNHIPKS